MSSGPLLGTPYIAQSTSNSNTTAVTPTLCHNLSAFKSLLRASRSLDDSITLRLNRASALARTAASGRGAATANGEECDLFWNELVKRWKERTETLKFCDEVVRQGVSAGELPQVDGLDRERMLRGRGDDERQVKRRQIHSEIDVEGIVRARSIAFFASRCPNHSQLPPPPALPIPDVPESEVEGSGRRGRNGGTVRWNG